MADTSVRNSLIGGGGGTDFVVNEFITSQTYTAPVAANYKGSWVIMIGPGTGAGSGRRGAASSAKAGGGAGAGGNLVMRWISATEMPDTVVMTIPAGSAGGAANNQDDTNGNPGAQNTAAEFGSLLTTNTFAQNGGNGGTTSLSTGGTGNYIPDGIIAMYGGNGDFSNPNGSAGGKSNGGNNSRMTPGGGGGGSENASNVANNGGDGGGNYVRTSPTVCTLNPGPTGGTVDSGWSTALNGADNVNLNFLGWDLGLTKGIGEGGAGAGPSQGFGADPEGGQGGDYGAGGGGGGTTRNGSAAISGKGGDGGNALIIVIDVYGAAA